ncbi:MAG: penicillin-binding protein 2 [Myxococcota bacterium]
MSSEPNISKRGKSGAIADYQGRYLWLIVLFGLVFAVILARLWYLQIIRGEEYHRVSSDNIIRDVEIPAPRGRILDRNGRVLAENRASFDIYIIPHIFKQHDEEGTLRRLKRYLNLSDDEVDKLRRKAALNGPEVLVRRDANRKNVAELESDRMRLPGVEVRANQHRNYPLNKTGAHTIGFLAEASASELDELEKYGYGAGDYIGRMGIEKAFEEVLSGSPGIRRQVVDAQGIPQGEAETRFLIGDYRQVEPIPGRDVSTSLDAELMLSIDAAMRGYPSGGVVALDPRDGSILAMYSKPGFNPNSWTGRLSPLEKLRSDNDPFKPMLDKTVNAYFPGSVFKIAGSAAALEEGLFEPDDTVKCYGSYKFGGRRFRCWKWGGHGRLELAEALQHSCDVYYYRVADELGIDTVAKYAYDFGFGEKSGFPLNRERAGRVPTKEWHRKHSPNGYQYGFALNTILGQGDTLTTPLQVALAYGAIANGGKLYYPRVVDQIRNGDGEALFEFEPRVRKRVGISDETMAQMREGLRMAVNEDGGTAYSVRLDDIEVSGKTGTAQVHEMGAVRIANRDKEFQLRDHAWFTAYAPTENPEIVIAVFLEHAGHGGAEAAPVAMKVLQQYFDRRDEAMASNFEKLPDGRKVE